MADVYGSTLDSLMANKAAQQAGQQAEANSYRNFLNQTANTNLRRREGEALDRRGMEELAINRMNVAGLNDYRRGQVDIGMEDARTRRYEGETGRENVRGLNLYRGGQVEIGKSDAATRLLDTQSMGTYRAGLTQNEANRIASGERLGMQGFATSEKNVGRQAQAMEYGAEAGVRSAEIQAGANMFDSANRLEAASLDYNKLRRGEQLAFDQGGIEGLKQFRAAANPANENLRLMQAADQQEEAKMRRSAYGATMDQLNQNFQNQTTGFFGGAASFNDNRTKQIQDEMERLKVAGMPDAEAYDEALARVSRRVVDARFGARPPVNEILRNDRYDVKPGGGMSSPQEAPSGAAPTRVFNARGRQAQQSGIDVQQPEQDVVDPSQRFGPPSPAEAFRSRGIELRQKERTVSNASASSALTTPFYTGAADALGVEPEQVGASNRYKRPRSVVADNWGRFEQQFQELPEDVKNSVYINSLNAASDVTGTYSPGYRGYRNRELPTFDWMTKTQQ